MKRFILLLIIFSISIVISCEKTNFKNTGTITGADMAMCACCGGYFIDIDGNKYRFEKTELPSDFTFEDKQLPFTVKLDWDLKPESCSGFNWIKISKIRKI